MLLSENFTLEEMISSTTAQRLGIPNFPGPVQIVKLTLLCKNILQPIRNKIKCPLIVTSGFRSSRLNSMVKGSPSSQHLKGEAADIVCKNNHLLWSLILDMIKNKEIEVGQLIDEKNLSWIHISLPSSSHKNQILHL